MGTEVMCYKGRHTLLRECLILSFLRCMRKMGGISNCTYNVPHGIQCAISAKIESQIACKSADLSGFSALEMRCCATKSDNHCCLSVSRPSFNVWQWLEELLITSTRLLMVSTVWFLPRLSLKWILTKKYQILDTPSEWELICCAIRKDIHCWLIAS